MKRKRVTVRASDVLKRVTVDVQVVGLRRLRVRLFIARQLVRVAGWIGGFNVTMRTGE